MNIDPDHSRVLIAGSWSGDVRWLANLVRTAAANGMDTMLVTGDLDGEECPDMAHDVDELIAALSKATGAGVLQMDSIDAPPVRPRAKQPGALVFIRDNLLWVPRGHVWQWHGRTFGALGGASPQTSDLHLYTPLDVLLSHAGIQHDVVRDTVVATRPRLHVHGDTTTPAQPYTHHSGDHTDVRALPRPNGHGHAIVLDLNTLTATNFERSTDE